MTTFGSQEFYLICDDLIIKTFGFDDYSQGLEEAAQLDWEINSPEMNDGIQRYHSIRLI